MNIAQAKMIPLVELLAAKGFSPHHIRGNDAWYLSPFRDEKTPSFKVHTQKNVWYDHGTGEGGDIINLIQIMFNEPNIRQALAMLDNFSSFSSKPTVSIPVNKQKVQETIIHSVREIENFALEQFLKKRAISVDRAKNYLSEIHYQRGDSTYFALSHPNEAGGFEVKNSIFSGSVNKKAISYITGEGERKHIAIFEGMFDFLALLELHNIYVPPHDVIVLNSLSLAAQAEKFIEKNGYELINLYLDNDRAGQEASQKFIEHFREKELEVSNKSLSYANHKDINDLLIAKQQKQIALDITISKQDPFTL